MRSSTILFFVFIFSAVSLFAETPATDKVVLKSGTVYYGQILVQNDEIVLLKANDGKRFQFQRSDVKEVALNVARVVPLNADSAETDDVGNMCGVIEATSSVAYAGNYIDASPAIGVHLLFGTKMVDDLPYFAGIGTGVEMIFASGVTQGFIPLFARFQKRFNERNVSPYAGVDAGYAFAIGNNDCKGGPMATISAGIGIKAGSSSQFLIGVDLGIRDIKGKLTEDNSHGNYIYEGHTSLFMGGLRIALQF